ncbi:MAG TPA: hypothetical protein VJ302_20830 [Blastocatellia bacterium]|nr:hypothetical protein [Blastocatellia bacterium]
MNDHRPDSDEDQDWNLVYLIVILFTILVIAGLWVFSRKFQ